MGKIGACRDIPQLKLSAAAEGMHSNTLLYFALLRSALLYFALSALLSSTLIVHSLTTNICLFRAFAHATESKNYVRAARFALH